MANITVVNRKGEEKTISVMEGANLMQALRDDGYEELVAMCGGNCACATCHVYIDDDITDISEPSLDETELLAMSVHHKDSSRLSCQVTVTDSMDGMRVVLAPED